MDGYLRGPNYFTVNEGSVYQVISPHSPAYPPVMLHGIPTPGYLYQPWVQVREARFVLSKLVFALNTSINSSVVGQYYSTVTIDADSDRF